MVPGIAWQDTTASKIQRGVVIQNLHISNNEMEARGNVVDSLTAHSFQTTRWQLRRYL